MVLDFYRSEFWDKAMDNEFKEGDLVIGIHNKTLYKFIEDQGKKIKVYDMEDNYIRTIFSGIRLATPEEIACAIAEMMVG
jgi:hypothetical protein